MTGSVIDFSFEVKASDLRGLSRAAVQNVGALIGALTDELGDVPTAPGEAHATSSVQWSLHGVTDDVTVMSNDGQRSRVIMWRATVSGTITP